MNDNLGLPSTEEVVEPISKLLDFLGTYQGDWSDIPQIAALREAFLKRQTSASRDLAYTIWTAIEVQMYGPFPRDSCEPHPQRDQWNELIHAVTDLATKKVNENGNAAYRAARQVMLKSGEIASRLPRSIKSSENLAALRSLADAAARDAYNIEWAKRSFFIEEFRPLASWLDGRPLIGSPEWVAQETWYVKTALTTINATLHRIAQIRDAVKGEGVYEARESRWKRFVETEFSGDKTINALEVAWAAVELMAHLDWGRPMPFDIGPAVPTQPKRQKLKLRSPR
jgi:hypothetical protein